MFFCDTINALTLRRGMGRSMFNETMTAATMDNPEAARVLRLMHKWIYEDRIIPTQADLDFFAGSDTNTSRIQLFRQGRYALLTAARYSIVQLRDGDPMNMVARPLPHGGSPMACWVLGVWAFTRNRSTRNSPPTCSSSLPVRPTT